MMLNKVLCIVGLTAAVVAVADDSGFACSGFYAGLSGGVMQTAAEISASPSVLFTNYYDDENQLSSFQEADIFKNTGMSALYAGYRQPLNNSNVFMGAEVFGNIAKRTVTLNNFAYHQQPNDDEDFQSLTTTSQAKLNDEEFGVDLQPGYLFDTHTMLYGRIGVAFDKLTLSSNSNFLFTSTYLEPPTYPEIITYHSPLATSKTKDVTALRLGLGVEHGVGNNLSITADYIYTDYGKVNTSGIADATAIHSEPTYTSYTTANGLVGHASAHLATQALMVGLKYTFPAI